MSIFTSIRLLRGKVLEGEKIRELTNDIIDKFSNEKLSYDEAVIIFLSIAGARTAIGLIEEPVCLTL